MTALFRYQLELLFRSQRWLPPFLTYALLMVIGVTAGDALLGAYGYTSAVLLPVTAWYVRCAATAEPAASRACLTAAAGGPRVHLAAVLAAAATSLALGLAGWAVIFAISGKVAARGSAPLPEALLAGLLATLTSVLLGLLVGVLCTRPVLLRAQYGIPLSLGLAILLLALPGSPGNTAVGALVKADGSAPLVLPLAALAEALLLAALAITAAALTAGRRTENW